ncbi:maintenance of mitochondrial morphology protein 1 [Cyathus striatus]|nr:maintenance of mitochondrial morphology protein 1 [Cyathus striatus]
MSPNSYIFSLQPTFTQGLVLGQLSIIVLLGLVLKYLFLDSTQYPFETSSYHPRVESDVLLRKRTVQTIPLVDQLPDKPGESAEWFNVLFRQIANVYRSKLRDDLSGLQGDEIARKRIEDYANRIRPAGFMDHITINSVDLGVSAPSLFNARVIDRHGHPSEIEVDAIYTDTLSISLSTSYLFNYPMASFARLPISLTISLSHFKSSITIAPPATDSPAPVLTLCISPNFVLNLTTTSLMGSRAKLANVPKLHELIQHQVRRVLAARATWKVVLPGLASVTEVKEEIKKGSEDRGL